MTDTISKTELRAAFKEILKEERGLLKQLLKELMEEEVRASSDENISDEELRLSAKRQFQKYATVFRSLAESEVEGKERLEKIIKEDFERYDDVFRKLAE